MYQHNTSPISWVYLKRPCSNVLVPKANCYSPPYFYPQKHRRQKRCWIFYSRDQQRNLCVSNYNDCVCACYDFLMTYCRVLPVCMPLDTPCNIKIFNKLCTYNFNFPFKCNTKFFLNLINYFFA